MMCCYSHFWQHRNISFLSQSALRVYCQWFSNRPLLSLPSYFTWLWLAFDCFMPHYSICTLIRKVSDCWAHIQRYPTEHMVTPTWKWSKRIGIYLIASKLLNRFCKACRPIFSWEEVEAQISHLCRVSSKGKLELTPSFSLHEAIPVYI